MKAVATIILVGMGSLIIIKWIYDYISHKRSEYKHRKKRKTVQKKRLHKYETDDSKPAPLDIARQYANEIKQRGIKRPMRKATGFYSDIEAQEKVM